MGASPTDKTQQLARVNERKNLGAALVLQSLAQRQVDIFKELAILLSTESRNDVPYKAFLKSCQQKMLIDTDPKLREIVSELIDHSMLQMRTDKEGIEVVSIPLSQEKLKDIIKFQR